MADPNKYITERVQVKNMVCNCCIILLQQKLKSSGIEVLEISLGKVKVKYAENQYDHQKIDELIGEYGFKIIENKDEKLVSEIKIAVIELVHQMNNVNSIVRKSDYLVEKLGFSYPHLAKVFTDYENKTLEKYIINQKIERIKYLLDEDEYTLSEIAYMMDYSSVQYLSSQFKKITGLTVSQYKSGSEATLRNIGDL